MGLYERVETMELNEEMRKQLSQFYKMFADETRIRILFLLETSKKNVNEIAESLSMTPSSISHQLQTLRLTNFVRYEKIGKEVYYALADDHIKIILEYGLEHIKEEMDAVI